MRPLGGRTTTEVLDYLGSSNGIESTLGLAVANALANEPQPDHLEGDVLEILPIRSGDRVGMVGYFGPLVAPLERRGCDLTVFERDAARSKRVLPAEKALELLPVSDVAIITSTALILGDLDHLLQAASPCREVAVIGASTPLVPDVFRWRGVTLLSGITVTDGARILQIVSEGGGMAFFADSIRKVNIRMSKT
jgi:uncharacterized protein (DUF4213/DUF364 family)